MQRIGNHILAVCIAMAAVIGMTPSHVLAQAATPTADANQEANEALVRDFFAIASTGDLNDLTALVTPGFVIQTAPPGEGTTLEMLTQTFQAARTGLPDFTIQIDDLFVQDDWIVVRTTITGTHLDDFFGSPPTGQRIETDAIDLWRVEDGKLAENWHYEHILRVMEQIAAAPAAGAVATPTTADHIGTQ